MVKYSYETPNAGEFRFGFTSDPQIKENGETNNGGWNPSDGKNQTGWAVMLDKMKEEDVNPIVSAGDQVEDQSWENPSEYGIFAPEEMTSLLYAPAVGNHDRHYMFDDHFNLPNEMSVDGNAASLNQRVRQHSADRTVERVKAMATIFRQLRMKSHNLQSQMVLHRIKTGNMILWNEEKWRQKETITIYIITFSS